MTERKRIGLREVRALGPGEMVWDTALRGFYARRQKGDASYGVFYRTAQGRQRWMTIARHGALTPDEARKAARDILADVVKGRDPAAEKQAARKASTVAELCRQYLSDAESGRLLVRGGKPKKPLTLASDRGRIEGHIIPLLGKRKVAEVDKQEVEKFMHAVAEGKTAKQRKTKPRGVSKVRGGQGVAGRSVSLLGAIFTYAIDKGLRADNPAHRVQKFAENRRERRLSDDEYAALGAGLRQAVETIWPPAVACLRFLALTGWRSGEALALRWRDVDLVRRTAILPDSKSGRSMRPLSHAACDLLRTLTRLSDAALVFPASRGDGLMTGFKKFARRIIVLAGLPEDITPHVLRHSFVSLAADLEYSEPTIAALVGHKLHSITSRYTHHADAPLLAAADAVAGRTAALMGDGPAIAKVVELRASA